MSKNILREFLSNLIKSANELLKDDPLIVRTIKDVDEWDGSASRWPSTEDYCNDSLINLNEGDPTDWTQDNCKLPIREPGDSPDVFVRQAVFAAAGGNGIQAVDAPEEAKREAALTLIQAYDEMGEIGPDAIYEIAGEEVPDQNEDTSDQERAISFSQIYEQVWSMTWDHGYLVDVFDEEGQMYAIVASNGLLFRQQLSIVDDKVVLAGDPFEVAVDYPAVQTRTTINRQVDGKYRWFSISATSVLNRVGEIDSKALFDSFVSHVEDTGEYPIREFYHQGDNFRTGQCDLVARDGNCLITSGIFDDTVLARAEIQSRNDNPDYWGESIGYKPTSPPEMLETNQGVSIPVYTTGILREISTLPEKEAANLFTVTNQQEEVNRMLTGRGMDALVKMFGDDEEAAQKWLSENAGELNRTITEKGLINREKPAVDNDQPIQIDDTLIDEIVNRLGQRDAIATLQSEVQGLVSTLETINANQGDIVSRLDDLQTDANSRFEKLERTKAQSLQESIVNLPSVPQVRRYEYAPRQGATVATQNSGTMANEAASLKNHY